MKFWSLTNYLYITLFNFCMALILLYNEYRNTKRNNKEEMVITAHDMLIIFALIFSHIVGTSGLITYAIISYIFGELFPELFGDKFTIRIKTNPPKK